MGLAASQARLLTITSRKSRAQFESMRLSHEKLALSRNLTDISNEYQNSLDQTKLYYDFYGVNSTDNPLTYGLLMSPSSLNDYTPTLISNNQGQVILSAPYAAAAQAAGIPEEGLGCMPSSIMRDAFVMSLAEQGIITMATALSICQVDYNQLAGLGSDSAINTITTTGDYNTLLNTIRNDDIRLDRLLISTGSGSGVAVFKENTGSATGQNFSEYTNTGHDMDLIGGNAGDARDINIADILSGNLRIYLGAESGGGNMYATVDNVIKTLAGSLSANVDGADAAIAYANRQMQEKCWGFGKDPSTGQMNTTEAQASMDHKHGSNNWATGIGGTIAIAGGVLACTGVGALIGGIVAGVGAIIGAIGAVFNDVSDSEVVQDSLDMSANFLTAGHAWGRSGWFHDDPHDQETVDLTAYVQAWFTYFMQYMYGMGTAGANNLDVKWNDAKSASRFADGNTISDFTFTFTKQTVSDHDALISNFYDTLFNQICLNGWNKNDKVAKDSNYLKEMLQSGMMYVTSMSDDYYYYQNNYSTNNFIKEVSDDAAIAQAESRYTTEKARINAKEQELDLKMKNLDTEISSLETEYEAVKKVIEGNVSKSFTRYDS